MTTSDDADERGVRDSGRQKGMKIEIVATRDPDGENEYAVFVDGVRDDSAVQIYDIDPGRGYSRSDWLEFRTIEGASPAANDYHEQTVDSYVRSEWIEDE